MGSCSLFFNDFACSVQGHYDSFLLYALLHRFVRILVAFIAQYKVSLCLLRCESDAPLFYQSTPLLAWAGPSQVMPLYLVQFVYAFLAL